MKHVLLSSEQKQFRANLHCHSVLSDGCLTPEELKDAYRARGYSILAITDHERPKDHTAMSEEDFLMLTGYESHIRQTPDGVMDPYAAEIHMNFFAKDPHNETFIGYDDRYGKFVRKDPEFFATMKRAGAENSRTYTTEYINEHIRTAIDNGYLVTYNHPAWSLEDEARILSYENIFSLEISNFGSDLGRRLEHNGVLYNHMLRRGMRIFCHGSDDNHNRLPVSDPLTDSFGAWTMIASGELTYANVIRALECGDFYASTGPDIHEISFEDGKVHVACSRAAQIVLHCGSKRCTRVFAPTRGWLTEAELALDERADFFRVAVYDATGGCAQSRGYFRDEFSE